MPGWCPAATAPHSDPLDLFDGTGALAIALPESRDKARTADVGDTMRPGVAQARNSRNELAWLVLRVISGLAPCTETSLIAYISGDYTMSDSPRVRVVRDALLKLEALGFIESAKEQISITDAGGRFLDELPVNPASIGAPHAVFLSTHVPPSLASSPAT